jgi:hypothetical protein
MMPVDSVCRSLALCSQQNDRAEAQHSALRAWQAALEELDYSLRLADLARVPAIGCSVRLRGWCSLAAARRK